MAIGSERPGSGQATRVGAAAFIIGVTAVVVVVLLSRPADPEVDGAAEPAARSSADLSASGSPPVSPPARAPSSSLEPSASATVEPVDGWQEAAMFGSEGGLTIAASVTRGPAGFIAVGTHYPVRPILIVESQEGRVWHSLDGRAWEDVTPPDVFIDASLTHIIATAHGTLIAIGGVIDGESGRYRPMAWESPDGRAWSGTPFGFPDGSTVGDLARGARGYLAIVGGGLWLSSDGRTWEMVLAGDPAGVGILAVEAGDEGFVALGSRGGGDASETYVIASSDGRQWIEASAPPISPHDVVPRGGDWIAIGRDASGCDAEPGDDRVWSSIDGLEWTEVGSIPWRPILVTGRECWTVGVDLHAAGSWLISSPSQRGACCDQPPTPGTQQISRDGRFWESLPLPVSGEGQLGSSVIDAIANGEELILIGQSNDRAAFWFNEAP